MRAAIRAVALFSMLMATIGMTASAAFALDVVADPNLKCADYGLLTLTKFDPPNSGTRNGVTLTVDGTHFTWTSDTPVDKVLVKGGPVFNVHSYNEATEGSGVTATNRE